ncbi:hypothetical protein Trydic_g23650 [Trypoxylus dichotomus]
MGTEPINDAIRVMGPMITGRDNKTAKLHINISAQNHTKCPGGRLQSGATTYIHPKRGQANKLQANERSNSYNQIASPQTVKRTWMEPITWSVRGTIEIARSILQLAEHHQKHHEYGREFLFYNQYVYCFD